MKWARSVILVRSCCNLTSPKTLKELHGVAQALVDANNSSIRSKHKDVSKETGFYGLFFKGKRECFNVHSSIVTEILQLRKERRRQRMPLPPKAITTALIHKKNDFLQRQ